MLTAVARRLLTVARNDATLFRWGGEEFLLLAPIHGQDDPGAIVLRILGCIGNSPIAISTDRTGADAHGQGGAIAMTCSIGWELAALADDASIREALRRADLHLYAAKHAGRDRAQGPDGIVGLRQPQ